MTIAEPLPRPLRIVSGGPAVIVMVGVPGSGKSVLGRIIAEAIDAVVIQTDAVRKRLFPRPSYTAKEVRTVYAVCHRQLASALAAGRRVVFDATNLQERTRDILYRAAEGRGAAVIVVAAYAPETVIRDRLAARAQGRDPDDRSDADLAVYLRMRRSAEPIAHAHVVANTCVSPMPVLAIVRRLIEGAPPVRA